MAFSALGNIVIQTFIAARVKQETAKEGILPESEFFAKNYSLTRHGFKSNDQNTAEPEENTVARKTPAKTPAAALLLHWVFAVILILATVPAKGDSYRIPVNVYSFIVNAVFGSLVGLALLVLRLNKKSDWSNMSDSNAWVSVITAAIFTIANLFPLVAIWIPPSGQDSSFTVSAPWFTVGTVGVSVMAFAVLYWLVVRYAIPFFWSRELETDREYDFIKDHGHWVMWHEVVSIGWPRVQKVD